MRKFRLITVVAVAAACLLSCSKGASVKGVFENAPNKEIIVKKLDINKFVTLDTLETGKKGEFSYKVAVAKAQPEFIYLFYGENRIASLLLQNGDKVQVNADTLGNYTVAGSEETLKLIEAENESVAFKKLVAKTDTELEQLEEGSAEYNDIRKGFIKEYIAYYRSRVKFLMDNYKSLAVIPVLYETLDGAVPVFAQNTDAIHFRACVDSLKTVYPESKYVKALEQETLNRENLLKLNSQMSTAEEIGYVDLSLPDINSKKVRISDIDSKVIMLYFWSTENATQSMFNKDVLVPLYEKYHSKGLEIYSISLDTDKTAWATVVKNQDLKWINVCDGKGAASPAVSAYRVASVPLIYFIVDGTIVGDPGVRDEASLKKYLSSIL